MLPRNLINTVFALISFILLHNGYATVLQSTGHEHSITHHNSITALTSSNSRQSCGVRGFDLGNAGFGCASFSDVLDNKAETIFGKIIEFLSSSLGSSDEDISDIVKGVLLPLVSGVESIAKASPLGSNPVRPQDSNVCFGNFDSKESFRDLEGVCGLLPLGKEWTVLGFALNAQFCPGISSAREFVSICAAVNYDSCTATRSPSVALSFSTNIFMCGGSSNSSTSGVASKAVFKAIKKRLKTFTFGVSLSRSLTKEFNTFNGKNVVKDFETTGVILASGTFQLSPDDLKLPSVFEFSGEATMLINIDGNAVKTKSFLAAFKLNAEDSPEVLLRSLTNIRYSILYQISLQVKFAPSKFSELRKLAGAKSVLQFALPDSENILIGRSSLFVTTYDTTSGGTTLQPGVYVLATAVPASAAKALLNYILSFSGEVLDSLTGWATPGFKVSDLIQNLKVGGSTGSTAGPTNVDGGFLAGLAFRVPDAKADLRVRVPLLSSALGFVEISCEIDLDEGSFSCSAKTDFGRRIFNVAAILAKDSVIFVAREVRNIGESALKASGPVLAAGSSALGDAAKPFGSALSSTTIADTAKAISTGTIKLSELGDVGLEVSAWAVSAGGRLDDIADTVSGEVITAARIVGTRGNTVVNKLRNSVKVAKRKLSGALSSISNGLGCGVSAVETAITGNGGSCKGAVMLVKTLEDVGGSIAGAAKNIGGEVERGVEKVVGSIGNFISGEKVKRVEKKKTREIDDDTNCPIIEYVSVYVKKLIFIEVSGDRRRTIGKAADPDCVKQKLQLIVNGENAELQLEVKEKELSETSKKYGACLKVSSITKDFLRNMVCKTTVHRERTMISRVGGGVSVEPCTPQLRCNPGEKVKVTIGKPRTLQYSIPVEVICNVPVIKADGTFRNLERVSILRLVDVLNVGISLGGVEEQVKQEIVEKLTSKCPQV